MVIKTTKKKSFVISILLIIFIFSFISFSLFSDYFSQTNNKNIKELIGSISVLVLILIVIYCYLKIPKIEMNHEKIIFKTLFSNKQYSLKDIKKVMFTGKMPMKYCPFDVDEGMLLEFNTNEKIFVYDDFYGNLWKIKNKLYRITNKSLPSKEKYFKSNTIIKGSLFTILGLSSLFSTIFFIFIILKIDYSNISIGLLISLISFLIIPVSIGNLLYYFEFNHDKLIVKNHLFFWFKKEYETKSIKEVTIEHFYRIIPDGLRIISNNFETKVYRLGTYKEIHWNELLKNLNKAYIKVRYN